MIIWNHKCQWCDRIYACECQTVHKRKNPLYDCHQCVHRPETIISSTAAYNTVLDGSDIPRSVTSRLRERR